MQEHLQQPGKPRARGSDALAICCQSPQPPSPSYWQDQLSSTTPPELPTSCDQSQAPSSPYAKYDEDLTNLGLRFARFAAEETDRQTKERQLSLMKMTIVIKYQNLIKDDQTVSMTTLPFITMSWDCPSRVAWADDVRNRPSCHLCLAG